MRPGNQALPDDQTGIAVGVSSHLALGTQGERSAGGVPFYGVPLGIANDQARASSAFSGGIAWVNPTRDHPQVPRLVCGEGEDPPLHPVGSFPVSPVAIRAFFRLEVPQMLEDQDTGPLLLGEQHNASAHQMGNVLIDGSDLAPEVGIVLFIFGNDASLRSVACNPS